ncbi:hypothetical protein KC19_8G100200 [Ceratodon purpureus]|uniref:Uncharacterized protein n=1 Tax=Ceratodon purpureus TaxID=3225 RepID=A0A8T0H0H2_CERPU|nr:hypothetical protein KC19_8G100200 [Ceratodon purpureus]
MNHHKFVKGRQQPLLLNPQFASSQGSEWLRVNLVCSANRLQGENIVTKIKILQFSCNCVFRHRSHARYMLQLSIVLLPRLPAVG